MPKLELSIGRGSRIRTCDLLVPNQTRYQTALCPDPVESAGFTRVFRPDAQGPSEGLSERKKPKKPDAEPNPLQIHCKSGFRFSGRSRGRPRLGPERHVYDGRELLGSVRRADGGFVAVAFTGSTKRTIGLFSTLIAAVRALPPNTITTPTKKRKRPQPASTAAGAKELIYASPKYAKGPAHHNLKSPTALRAALISKRAPARSSVDPASML